jgi:hypothetical protein
MFMASPRGGEAAAVFTLNGEINIDHDVEEPGEATIGIRVNTDGTIDKQEGTTYTQLSPTTDYVIPNDADKTDVRFKVTNNGDTLDGTSDAVGSWVNISIPRVWRIVVSSEGTASLNLTLEVSSDAGSSTEDSGVYTGTAEVTVP